MKLQTPHIIKEGNEEFRLGTLKGNHILYDFDKILLYLNAKGKLLFGKNFKIYESITMTGRFYTNFVITKSGIGTNVKNWGLI